MKLTIFEENGQLFTDSREVAQALQIRHTDLLEKINSYANYLCSKGFRSLEFFISSTYLDSKGEKCLCYQITKKGCDMIAGKLTGRKSTMFIAAYIGGFHKMQGFIKGGQTMGNNVPLTDYIESVGVAADILRIDEVGKTIMLKKAFESKGLPSEFLPSYVEE